MAIVLLLTVGCSGSILDTTAENPAEIIETNVQPDAGRMLWGIWDIRFDTVSWTVTAEPMRTALAHFNITDWVLPPACDDCFKIEVNGFDIVTRLLDVDVTLRNPTQLTARDVRGIVYTNEYGHELPYADGWTSLWDIPGGGAVNPFMGFAKSAGYREFAPDAEHVENYIILIPIPPHWNAIQFAVDVSWPGNCREPYAMEDFSHTDFLAEIGETSDLQVTVRDWQDDVEEVKLAAGEFTGAGYLYFTNTSVDTWEATLVNNEIEEAGDYDLMLTATSSGTVLPMHQRVRISPDDPPGPKVLGIEPSHAERGDDLSGVVISGKNFEDVESVKLKMTGEPDIETTNVSLIDEETIECDMSISPFAPLGYYDIEVVFTGWGAIVGEGLFKVHDGDPHDPVDVTPDLLNMSPFTIAVSGEYLFVSTLHCGLHIFDITDPLVPVWLTEYETPGPQFDTAISGDYLYIAMASSGLQIVDISEPASPSLVHTAVGFDAYGVYVKDDYAYVTRSTISQGGDLYIVDISEPESAYVEKSIHTPGYACDVVVEGGYAYLCDSVPGFHVIDIDPIGSAHIVKTVVFEMGMAFGVALNDGYAYVTDGSFKFHVIDIHDPESAYILKTVEGVYGQPANPVYKDGYVYTVSLQSGLDIFDVSTPSAAEAVHHIDFAQAMDIAIAGNFAYIADGSTGLHIVDISNPESAYIAGHRLSLGKVRDIDIRGDTAYAINPGIGLVILDISEPEETDILKIIPLPEGLGESVEATEGYVYGGSFFFNIIDVDPVNWAYIVNTVDFSYSKMAKEIRVVDGYAYFANFYSSLEIIDIDPPGDAHVVKSVDTSYGNYDLAIQNGYAYLATHVGGLLVVDIDPIEEASVVHSVEVYDDAHGVAVDGDYAYVADSFECLTIIDISTPEAAFVTKHVLGSHLANAVDVQDGYAYVCFGSECVKVYDVDPVASAHFIVEIDVPEYARRVRVDGNYAYIACTSGGFRVIKLW